MDIPLYRLLLLTAEKCELLWLLQDYQKEVTTAIFVLAILFCFFGFYCYRGAVSGLLLIAVVLASFIFIYPASGRRAAAAAAAVVGVVMAFLGFRFFRLGAVLLSAVVAGSFVWIYMEPSVLAIILIIAAALALGAFTFFFPFWGVCGSTALWGAITFSATGGLFLPFLRDGAGAVNIIAAVVLFGAGLALQLLLFKKQKIFLKIMPRRIEYMLEKRKREGGAS